jgi:multicomponent Na+:H+ antiporter subunit C
VSGAPFELFLLVGAALFAFGAAGVFRDAEPLRRVIAVNIMGSGVFLLLVAIAARGGGDRPDPVPHAMVLTGIVVAVCATGVALVLADLSGGGEGDDDQGERP